MLHNLKPFIHQNLIKHTVRHFPRLVAPKYDKSTKIINPFLFSAADQEKIRVFNDEKLEDIDAFVDNTHLYEVSLQDVDQVKNAKFNLVKRD